MEEVKDADVLKTFWILLYIFGINTYNDSEISRKVLARSARGLFYICFSSSLLLCLLNTAKDIHDERSYSHSKITSAVLLAATVTMYVSLLRKKRDLKLIRKILKSHPASQRLTVSLALVYFLTFVAFAQPSVFLLYDSIWEREKMRYFRLLSFADDENWSLVVAVLNRISLGFAFITVPFVLNCVFCAVCCRWKTELSSLKDTVRRRVRSESFCCCGDASRADDVDSVVRSCRLAWRDTKRLREAFYSFLPCLVLKHTMLIFTLAVSYFKYSRGVHAHFEMVSDLVVYSVYFGVTSYLAAEIPEEMDELKAALREAYEESFFRRQEVEHFGWLQKRVEVVLRSESVALSVGGWADMRRNFILATFGSLVTYGVIFLQ